MVSFFEKLQHAIGSSSHSDSKLGIDISPSAVKVVQLGEKGGQAVLETYGEIALGPYAGLGVGQSANNLPAEKVAEALVDVMREAKVTTLECGVSIPFSASLISLIDVPMVSDEKLKEIIPIEARKYIPVPVSEVYLDWHVIPQEERKAGETDEKRTMEALVVAIHKETISRYQKIIELANLDANFFEIEIFSTIRAVLEQGVAPVAIIDLGFNNTKLYVVEHGVLRGSHNINKGTGDITTAISKSMGISMSKAEEIKRSLNVQDEEATNGEVFTAASVTFDYIFAEIQRMIIDFERKENKTLDKIVFTGGGSLVGGMLDLAKEKFDVEVEIADAFRKVETPAVLKDMLLRTGPEFAVAIGVALRLFRER